MTFDLCNSVGYNAKQPATINEAFCWNDSAWLKYRTRSQSRPQDCCLNIYEFEPVGFFSDGDFGDIFSASRDFVRYIKKTGYTYAELALVDCEMCFSLLDLQRFVNALHEAGIGVIVKIDANLVASGRYNNVGDFLKIFEQYHFDGLHISSQVKHLPEPSFFYRVVSEIKGSYDGVFIISDADNLGADFHCDLVWTEELYKLLSGEDNEDFHVAIGRLLDSAGDAKKIIPLSYSGSAEKCGMLIEIIRGDYEDKFRLARLASLLEICLPAKKLTFMGTEYAQYSNATAGKTLEWFMLDFPTHRDYREYLSALNDFYLSSPVLNAGEYRRLNLCRCDSGAKVVAFERVLDENNMLVIVLSFSERDTRLAVDISSGGEPKVLFDTRGEDFEIYRPEIYGNALRLFMPGRSGIVLTFDNKIIKYDL